MDKERKRLMDTFVDRIKELHAGKKESVGKMLELWDQDGLWEYAGPPPLVGSFRGTVALNVLFKNLTTVSEMELPRGTKRSGVVTVHDFKVLGSSATAEKGDLEWVQVLGFGDANGGALRGHVSFTFKGRKIGSVRAVIMPVPEASDRLLPRGLSLGDLTVKDIGRLALAAWAVV
jgi:hypothetical protein